MIKNHSYHTRYHNIFQIEQTFYLAPKCTGYMSNLVNAMYATIKCFKFLEIEYNYIYT